MSTMNSAFHSPWWLRGGHLQTLFQPFWRKLPTLDVQRERMETPDGDFLDLDWVGTSRGPIVVLLHGLTGSSRSPYIVGLQAALMNEGYRSVCMNFRGCSGSPNRTWRAYHSGETGDLKFVLETLRMNEPEIPIYAVGFSLGGNVLLKYLGEEGTLAIPKKAISVSAPLRLDCCASRLDQGLSRLYRNQLIRELKDYLRDKKEHLRQIGNTEDVLRIDALGSMDDVVSFWDYDHRVVAGLYGFESAKDYYEKSSAIGFLKAIARPTLIVQAKNDPFLIPSMVPQSSECSDHVSVMAPDCGGHVGFVRGASPWQPEYWLEGQVMEFLAEA